MPKAIIVILLIILSAIKSHAQLETKWWYFGDGAGMQFTENGVIADTSSTVNHSLGAATISNSEGVLQFYFAHDTLFNRMHLPMQNGTGLLPEVSSEQSTVIVPDPSSADRYYVFTSDLLILPQENGLFYHLVDMTLDNGLGGIVDTVKNIVLMDSTSERIAAVPHANGKDYWIMVQQSHTNKYHAFLVTEFGVQAQSVVNEMGLVTSTSNLMQGAMRFNHSGTAMACVKSNNLELFDFDAATGLLSNPRILLSEPGVSGDVEFSPDDSKVYTNNPIQFDATLPTAAEISNSKVILAYAKVVGIQMGLDGKLWCSGWAGVNTGYMGVIHNPNEAGLAANFQDSVLFLEGRIGRQSLPSFLSTYFKLDFSSELLCAGDSTHFSVNFQFIDSVYWDFGDTASGPANNSTSISPSHVYAAAGSYTVTLIAQNGIKTDTVVKTIHIKAAPVIDLGSDIDICLSSADSVKLGIGGKQGAYQWSTGATDTTIFVSSSMWPLMANDNIFPVELAFTDECGTDRDTVLVYGSEPLSVELGENIRVCGDSSEVIPFIDTLTPPVQYLWSDSSTNATLWAYRQSELEQTRTVGLSASNACGTWNDDVQLTFLAVPDGVLPNDSVYCLDDAFYLVRPNRTGITYQWGDGSADFQHYVDQSGAYRLTSYNECDTLRDTFNIVFNGEPKLQLPKDTAICFENGGVIRNPVHIAQQSYSWSDGSSDSVWVLENIESTSAPIQLWVRVTLGLCSVADSITIYPRGDCYDLCIPRLSNVFTPNSDGMNERLSSGLERCQMEHYQMSIYNRWGQLVFESTNPFVAWDGSINGALAKEGVYYYALTYSEFNGASQHYRGQVVLIR